MLPKDILTEARVVIGSKLGAIRERRNLTREQLAERVGCSTNTLMRIELGRFSPSMEQLLSILHELDCHFSFVENESEQGLIERLRQELKS